MAVHDYQQVRRAWAFLVLALLLGAGALLVTVCSFSFNMLSVLLILPALVFLVLSGFSYDALYFDYTTRRAFAHTCMGVGLGERTGKKRYRAWWYSVISPTRSDYIGPIVRHISGNFQQWEGEVVPLYGQTVEDFSEHADAFSFALRVPHIAFERGDGVIRMRAGNVLVPEAYEYPLLPLAADPVPDVLQAVPMAVDMAGQTWYMPIEGQHVLVAGRTGSGKNSYLWSLVFGLEAAILAGTCRIWAIDPKKVEMAIGKHWLYQYANEPVAMVELIEAFLAEMQARATAMHGVTRKFSVSANTPLNILMIDELAYLTALLPDKKLRDRGMSALTTILTQGRAIGYSVVGALQDPRKDTLPNRDSFTVRIALGLPEKQLVNMVLGESAYDKGAHCDELPLGPEGAGCGYVMEPGRREPLLLRAPWVSDEAIKYKLGASADTLLETPALVYPPYQQGYPVQLNFDGTPIAHQESSSGQ